MKPAPTPIVFTLNGARVSARAHPLKRLLDVLREDCGLTGTKEGCGEGECGACTVLVDGAAVNSCLVPVAQVAGATVVTVEGLRGRHPLQRAFAEHGGTQCGICTPGMIMAAAALGPNPSLDDVRTGLTGNLCRCTGYEGIYRAIRAASEPSAGRLASALRRRSRRLRAGQAGPAVPVVRHAEANTAARGGGGQPTARRKR
jgi:aerobic carbon-monoxide dehydrogenase small subunit